MRLYRLWTFVGCSLALVVWCQAARAEAAPEDEAPAAKAAAKQQDAKPADHNQGEPQVKQAPAPKAPVFREKDLLQELLILQPKRIPKRAPLFDRSGAAKPQAARAQPQKQQPKKQQPAARPVLARRRGSLGPSARYHLESMGTHVQLTPALRWHLNRSSGTSAVPPVAQLSSAATVPGQGAERYYPGISRSPVQKPFADLERPAGGLQTYWPLLLEGREDPRTGLIIWSFP